MSGTLSKELNRGTAHARLGLLEHNQHDHRDVHNHPGPVFLYRPGLAVYPGGEGGRGPTGCERSPHSTSRPPLAQRAAATRTHRHPRKTRLAEARSAALPPAGAPSAAQEREQGRASALPPVLERGTL